MCDGMMPKIINKYHTRGKGYLSREHEKCLCPLVGRNLQVGRAGQINKLVGWSVGWLVGCSPYSCTPSVVVMKKTLHIFILFTWYLI